MKWILCFIFIARIYIPMGLKVTYEINSFIAKDGYYQLNLPNGKIAVVPMMFTIIEEK